jgi:SAM-dependent methyltransferase
MDIEELRATYDVVAAEYASRFANELSGKPFDRKMLEWFAERVDGHGEILDLGCGPGHVALYLHDRKAKVRGIDLSDEMIRQARLVAPNVPFEQGDMLTLYRVPDASIAGIVALYSLVNFDNDDVDRALRQMHRVLIANGLLLLAVHLGEGTVQVDRFLDQDASLPFTFFNGNRLRGQVEAAGFVVTEAIEREPYVGHEYPSRRSYIFATRSPN